MMELAGETQAIAPQGAGPDAWLSAAGDIRDVLGTMTRQMAAAEARHVEALGEMRERLEQLGRQAFERRSRVPQAFAPVFDRIDDSLAALAERLAEVEAARRGDVQPAAATPTETHDETNNEPQPAAADAVVDVAVDALPVAGLRGPMDENHAGSETASIAAYEPALIEPSADEPWDAESAAALVRVYEAEGDLPFSPTPDFGSAAHFGPSSEPVAGVADGVPSAPQRIAAFAPLPVASEVERAWLEERFRDIASRIEQSFASIEPAEPAQAIAARFDGLEERLNAALDGLATRADIEGVQAFETYIADLSRQLDQTREQLGRLDGIEAQIADIAERVSADVAPVSVGATLSDAEIERIAGELVGRVVGRLPSFEAGAGAGSEDAAGDAEDVRERFDDMRQLIQEMLIEQRQGSEQTATMLDTMQQAMIRLLDRVDQLETGNHRYDQRNFASEMPAPSRAEAVEEAEGQRQGFGQRPFGRTVDEASAQAGKAAGAGEGEASLRERAPVIGRQDISAATAGAPADKAPGTGAPPRSREELAAAARRAMMAASETLPAQAPRLVADNTARPATDATAEPASAPKPGAGVRASVPPIGAAAPARKAVAAAGLTPRLRLLATMLGIVVALGAGYVMVDKLMGAKPKPRIERQLITPETKAREQTPGTERAPASGEQQDGNAAPGGQQAPRPVQKTDGSDTFATGIVVATANDITAGATTGDFTSVSANTGTSISLTAALPRAGEGERAAVAGASVSEQRVPPVLVGPNSLRLAAGQGDPAAEFEVGSRLAEGKGVPQDLAEAAIWYQRAAGRGHALSQYRLATLYERGFGVHADVARAKVWYRQAAEQGTVKAMHNLAVLSANTTQGAPDYATALRWFTAAAEHGLSDSQFNLAVLLEAGLGTEPDLASAYRWFSLAAGGGDREAAQRQASLRPRLAKGEAEQIEADIAQWRARSPVPAVNDAIAAGQAWRARTSQPS